MSVVRVLVRDVTDQFGPWEQIGADNHRGMTMTTMIARLLVGAACISSVRMSNRLVLVISFATCVGLSVTLVIAAVWGLITGDYVGAQVYLILTLTVMGSLMWGSLLQRTTAATRARETAGFAVAKRPEAIVPAE